MNNNTLATAREKKYDEFFTQYATIQTEVNAYLEYNPDTFRGKAVLCPCDDPASSNFTKFFVSNFEFLGLRRLVSTSYAGNKQGQVHGKIAVLEGPGPHVIEELRWQELDGDGDFGSPEVTALRDEADIIVTNPPFSLFRKFLDWILAAEKQFLIIGNQNAITYVEVFPYIKAGRIWLGVTGFSEDMVFAVPPGTEVDPKDRAKAAKLGYVGDYTRLGNSCWFTNLDHGRRHRPIPLMTMEDNIRYGKSKAVRERGYVHYENLDAIDVPLVDAIPSDYDGMMGVPKTFMDKYCPAQFEIIGNPHGDSGVALGVQPYDRALKKLNPGLRDGDPFYFDENGKPTVPFSRIIIRKRQQQQ